MPKIATRPTQTRRFRHEPAGERWDRAFELGGIADADRAAARTV